MVVDFAKKLYIIVGNISTGIIRTALDYPRELNILVFNSGEMPTVAGGFMNAKSFFVQVFAGILACFVTGLIHFKVQPFTKINTPVNAVAVAFSFWPGLIVGHIAIYLGRLIGEDELKLSLASEICHKAGQWADKFGYKLISWGGSF
jgi:hypothetical protein